MAEDRESLLKEIKSWIEEQGFEKKELDELIKENDNGANFMSYEQRDQAQKFLDRFSDL